MMRDLYGLCHINIDLPGDFGWTAQLENGLAGSFWLDNEKRKRKKENGALHFGILLATSYCVHGVLLL